MSEKNGSCAFLLRTFILRFRNEQEFRPPFTLNDIRMKKNLPVVAGILLIISLASLHTFAQTLTCAYDMVCYQQFRTMVVMTVVSAPTVPSNVYPSLAHDV
jgi:hypothetical protein